MNLMEVIGAFAPSGSSVSLQEAAYDGSDYYDPDALLGAVQGGSLYYRRLTQSPSDLSPITHERMQQMALYLYDRNPLAKRCLELIKDFVVGEGFRAASKDTAIQTAIDRFWEDGQNDLDQRMHALTLELGLWGEQLYAVFVHAGSGHCRIVSIDPRTIGEVIPDPTNSDLPYAVRLKGPIGTDSKYLKVIRENDDGLLVGADPDETVQLPHMTPGTAIRYYDPLRTRTTELGSGMGEIGAMDQTRLVGCFYFSVNKVQGSTRGRSDLLAVADLLDLYDRMVFDEAERMSFMRAHIYDVTIKGGTPQQITERAAAEAPPAPGTVKFHNDSEVWAAVSPDLKAQDGATTADLILSLISTGMGLPKTWLNGIMDINRATAMSMDGPSLKRLRTRQLYVHGIVRRMVTFALDQTSLAGGLPAPGDSGYDFAVESPEMSHKDLSTGSTALSATAQAMGMSQSAGWTDPDTAQQAISIMLSQIGVKVDADELKKRVEAYQKKQDDKAAEVDAGRIPSFIQTLPTAGGPPSSGTAPSAPTGGTPGVPAAGGAPPAAPPSGPAFVPLSPRDIPAAFAQMSTGLVALGNAGVIDAELAQEVIRQLLSGIGVQVDIVAMQARIDDQQAEDDQKQAEIAAATPPPPAPGAGPAAAPPLPRARPAGGGAGARPVPTPPGR